VHLALASKNYYLYGIQGSNGHTVFQLTAHIVWSTKYRYVVLRGDIQVRCRNLLIQICEAEDIIIEKGVVSKDHVHINYRASQSVSDIVKSIRSLEIFLFMSKIINLPKFHINH
jgi:putative transposase